MVRQCAANGCDESDATLTTHRFPKDPEVTMKWKDALNITRHTVEQLQKGFVVCTKHFAASSYRNEISNSLNTTAIPNLEQNPENERQYLRNKDKQPSVPSRCFKLPPNVDTSPKVQVFRCVKRVKSEEGQPAAKKQAVATVHSSDGSKAEVPIRPPVRQLAVRNSQRVIPKVLQMQSMVKAPKPSPQPAKRTQAHRHSQTDEPPAQETQPASKDDKIVELLYPEFKNVSKVQLIEQVKEKDQRIAVLEEKVKKLEDAMRNLL